MIFIIPGKNKMLMGIKLKANPTSDQRLILSQWMGCARFVWNAKCDEEKYLTTYARKYMPIGTYAPVDQKYSQYKNDELSPWLNDCPSQILRNSSTNYFQTYQNFIKGECGKPKRKIKSDAGSVHLTNELFRFEKKDNGSLGLFIGTKTNNIGYLTFIHHKEFAEPKSIYIKKKHGEYTVSFCYDDGFNETDLSTQEDNLKYLKGSTLEYLEKHTVGIDRGIVRAVQAGETVYDLTKQAKIKKKKKEKEIKYNQRRLAKQKKGANRRNKTKKRISKCHQKVANIRKDFCHKTSYKIVNNPDNKIIILEDLKIKNMSKAPIVKKNEQGKWEKNGANAKAGLNKSILEQGWYLLENYIKYKTYRAGKAWFKIPAYQTSQECAACGHTHPDNRKTQESFNCIVCGHTDNADNNAAKVIKKRAIKLILNSGTELSNRGVLLDTGRGVINKTKSAKAEIARGIEASKKKRKVTIVT